MCDVHGMDQSGKSGGSSGADEVPLIYRLSEFYHVEREREREREREKRIEREREREREKD